MNLSQFLVFEERLRQAPDLTTLQMVIVNLMQTVFPYYQAILFQITPLKPKVVLASNVSQIDEHAQSVVWLNTVFIPWVIKNQVKPGFIPLEDFPLEVNNNYQSLAGALYLPIYLSGKVQWGLIFWLDSKPTEEYFNALPLVSSAINHAWEKLVHKADKKKLQPSKWLYSKKKMAMVIGSIFLLLFVIRVHQYILVPAEVSPKNPILISPSISGAVHTIDVQPNALVKKDQLLFTLDDITVKNKYEESTEKLNVAKERYLKAYRHAFSDTTSLYEIAMLKGEVEQELVTQEYYKNLLTRTQVVAPKAGVILYSDPKNWLGKPVNIGEKVMLLAEPNSQEIIFFIPVDNMINIDLSIPVRFFPNENPTLTIKAHLLYVNPIAEVQPDASLSYFGVAKLENSNELQLGQKGIIKLYGPRISLMGYIMGKPLRYIRQHLGL